MANSSNVFDQFDASPAKASASSGNPFDQFDAPSQNRAEQAAEAVLGDFGVSPSTATDIVGGVEDAGALAANTVAGIANAADYFTRRSPAVSPGVSGGQPAGQTGAQASQDRLVPYVSPGAAGGQLNQKVLPSLKRAGAAAEEVAGELAGPSAVQGAVSGAQKALANPDVSNALNFLPALGAEGAVARGAEAAEEGGATAAAAAAAETPTAAPAAPAVGPITPEELEQKGVGGIGQSTAAAPKPRARVVDGKLVPANQAPSAANPDALFEPAADENARTEPRTPAERQQLANEAHELGMNETRESALQGDRLEAATDFDINKYKNHPAGQRMAKVIEDERQALRNVPAQMLEENGGVADTTEKTEKAAGKEMAAPIDEYRQVLENQVKSAYEDVKAQHGDTPLQPDALNKFLTENDPEFTAKASRGTALRDGVRGWLQKNGLWDAKTNQALPMNVYQAERLRQFVGRAYHPETAQLSYGLKDAIDDDVTKAAGADVYGKARQVRSFIGQHFEEQPSIAKLEKGDDRLGIDRKVPFEEVGKHIEDMSADEFHHYLGLLESAQRTSPELAKHVSKALTQVRAHFLRRILAEGDKTADMWNSKAVNAYLRANEDKISQVFRPQEIDRLQKLNRVGNAMRMDRSYRGADASRVLGEGFGIKALKKGAGALGTVAGAHVAGPVGALVGHGAAKGVEHLAAAQAERAVEKRIVNLADEAKPTGGAPRRLNVPRSQRGGPKFTATTHKGTFPIEHEEDTGPAGSWHTVKSANGETVLQEQNNGNLRAQRSDTAEGKQAAGEGTARLAAAADIAHARGVNLESDKSVSPHEVRAYGNLAKLGYRVVKNPKAEINPTTGNMVTHDSREPVFTVGPKAAQPRPLAERFAGQRGGPKAEPPTDEVGARREQKQLQTFHGHLMESVAARQEGRAAEVNALGHKYSVGDRVPSQNGPVTIIGKTSSTYSPEARDAVKAGDFQKAREIRQNGPQLPAYLVRHANGDTGTMMEWGMQHNFGGPKRLADAFPGQRGGPKFERQTGGERGGGPAPLKGMPTEVDVPGHGTVSFGPNVRARTVAANYMRNAGMPYKPPTDYAPLSAEDGKRVADAYDAMQHNPEDPETKKAYDALARETKAQWQAIKKSGLKVEFIKPGQADPYAASPRLAIMDVRDNNHLWVYPTDEGFGSQGADTTGHPLLKPSGVKVDGRDLSNNDLFRIVHDYFGHVKEGNGFRAQGEYNAYRQHKAMYSPAAQRALASETLGQNAWVNFGPKAAENKAASAAKTVYADQKAGLMPTEISHPELKRPPLKQGEDPAAALKDAQVQKDVEAAERNPNGKRPPLRQGDDPAEAIYDEQARQDAARGARLADKFPGQRGGPKVERQAGSEPRQGGAQKTLSFRHFSNAEGAPERVMLSPEYFGQGLSGAERRRMANNGGPKVISAYAGKHPDDQVEPELRGKPEYRITVPESSVYNLSKDPAKIRVAAKALAADEGIDEHTAAERLLKEHGYAGYHLPGAQGVLKGQARFFKPVEGVRTDVADREALAAKVPGSEHLTPDEREDIGPLQAKKLMEAFKQVPQSHELAAAALAGEAKRGWYRQAAHAISTVFGADAPRFAAFLAAMSPQTSVEMNFHNALRSFVAWDKAGRPEDPKKIVKLMEQNSLRNPLSKSKSNVLGAWRNNAVRALTSKDPESLQLSGPKVDSFMKNLRDNVHAVTLDSWMAKFAGMRQDLLGGNERKVAEDTLRGSLKSKNATYKAYSARVREAAELLTRMTGQRWTPEEVQETVWSWAKAASEHADETKTPIPKLLREGAIHDDLIRGASDFHSLFQQPGHAGTLRNSNFAEGLERLRGSEGPAQPRTPEEARAAAQARLAPHLKNAADRLEDARNPVPF